MQPLVPWTKAVDKSQLQGFRCRGASIGINPGQTWLTAVAMPAHLSYTTSCAMNQLTLSCAMISVFICLVRLYLRISTLKSWLSAGTKSILLR